MDSSKIHKLIDFKDSADFFCESRLINERDSSIVWFAVDGPLDEIKWPKKALSQKFTDKLWETTCFELFAFGPDERTYVEWNFSPSGHYAIYEFSDYRKKVRDLKNLRCQIVARWPQPGRFELIANIERPFEITKVNFAIVLETKKAEKIYYALSHSKEEPDFHDVRAFISL